ncbi:uncharacterized protein CIMG_13375 [Coccidioides immitis RS]|uniref:Uncharacterized protein n=1 Tax=Coccidioides immitis (strain RS) TaxID=246410 RepID=A0A0D8JVN8_COCIM|nr:uncharacterized protein CIMG_13375 [Coccidioides immitis RS]KJF61006.1 hypothetical protein CIMG_13375 [Coccidioides immitis RS]
MGRERPCVVPLPKDQPPIVCRRIFLLHSETGGKSAVRGGRGGGRKVLGSLERATPMTSNPLSLDLGGGLCLHDPDGGGGCRVGACEGVELSVSVSVSVCVGVLWVCGFVGVETAPLAGAQGTSNGANPQAETRRRRLKRGPHAACWPVTSSTPSLLPSFSPYLLLVSFPTALSPPIHIRRNYSVLRTKKKKKTSTRNKNCSGSE